MKGETKGKMPDKRRGVGGVRTGFFFVSRERNYFILIGLHLIRAHYETGGLKRKHQKTEEKRKKQAKLAAGSLFGRGNLVSHSFRGARCVYAICDVFYIINCAWWQLKGLARKGSRRSKQTTNTPTQTSTPIHTHIAWSEKGRGEIESEKEAARLIQKFHFRFSLASTVWHKSGKWGVWASRWGVGGKMRKYRTQGHAYMYLHSQAYTHICTGRK